MHNPVAIPVRKPLSQLASYQALRAHAKEIKNHTLREWFAQDPGRFTAFSVEHPEFLFDFSRNRISGKTLDILFSLLVECEVETWRDKLFAGDRINLTEDRAVRHTVLRELDDVSSGPARSRDKVLRRMEDFAWQVREEGFTDIVNLGAGGSRLGPMLVCDVFSDLACQGLEVHFVSNADAAEINRVLQNLVPATTLFIITSKSFTTPETLANAENARNWLSGDDQVNKRIDRHFSAVTARTEMAVSWGVPPQQVFPMWDSVGGRFSVWSAAGLSVVLYLGMPVFKELLRGANEMDEHFKTAPAKENIPVLLALLGIWNQHFLGASVQAVLPYDTRLHHLPAYLQQLEMESNGKCVDRSGRVLDVPGCTVVFGDVGTSAQHGFFQFLHQGREPVSSDFIGVVRPAHANRRQHDMLMANMIGQAEALMLGRMPEEVQAEDNGQHAMHRVFPGNRTSNMILFRELTPRTLGLLLALYEHKVFVQGIVLDINSFDQPGVEFGKRLAHHLLDGLHDGEAVPGQDCATRAALDYYRKHS